MQSPLLLFHSLTDDETDPSHSRTVFVAANQDRSELHLTDWGAEHAMLYSVRPVEYESIVDSFIARFASEFGRLQ